jgi:hypothetical protein
MEKKELGTTVIKTPTVVRSDAMAMPIVPATWEAEIGELQFKASLDKKLSISKKKPGMVVQACLQAMWKAEAGGSW